MKLEWIIASCLVAFHSVAQPAQNPGIPRADSPAVIYKKPLFDFQGTSPLFTLTREQQENSHKFLRTSVLTGYREGILPLPGPLRGYLDSSTGTLRIFLWNESIKDMLTLEPVSSNLVVLEVTDPSIYHYDSAYGSQLAWMRKNAWCYELMIPQELPAGMVNVVLRANLNRLFGVRSGYQQRVIKTLVLVRTSERDPFKGASGPAASNPATGNYINGTLADFAVSMNRYGNRPFKDETGYLGLVDMNLGVTSWTDIPALRKALQRYDLDLVEEMREMKVFVITEIK